MEIIANSGPTPDQFWHLRIKLHNVMTNCTMSSPQNDTAWNLLIFDSSSSSIPRRRFPLGLGARNGTRVTRAGWGSPGPYQPRPEPLRATRGPMISAHARWLKACVADRAVRTLKLWVPNRDCQLLSKISPDYNKIRVTSIWHPFVSELAKPGVKTKLGTRGPHCYANRSCW